MAVHLQEKAEHARKVSRRKRRELKKKAKARSYTRRCLCMFCPVAFVLSLASSSSRQRHVFCLCVMPPTLWLLRRHEHHGLRAAMAKCILAVVNTAHRCCNAETLHEVNMCLQVRLAAAAQTAGVGEQLDADEEALFDLNLIRGKAALATVGAVLSRMLFDVNGRKAGPGVVNAPFYIC